MSICTKVPIYYNRLLYTISNHHNLDMYLYVPICVIYRNDGGVIMKVSISKSKNKTIYYLSKSVRIGSKTTTKTIEKIGTYDEIKEKCK